MNMKQGNVIHVKKLMYAQQKGTTMLMLLSLGCGIALSHKYIRKSKTEQHLRQNLKLL